MRRKYGQRVLTVVVWAGVLLGLSGCVSETRTEMKANATNRWASTRGDIHFGLAKQQFDIGDLDKAEKTILQAIETKPDEAKYHVLAARILMERGSLERAFLVLKQAIEIEEKIGAERGDVKSGVLADAYYQTGIVQQRWQRYEEALASYEKTYGHEPDQPRGMMASAEMLVKLGRADEALVRLREKLVYFEHNPGMRVAMGRIQMLQGDYTEAASSFREAALLSNREPRVVEQLALAEYAAEQYGDAIRHLEELIDTKAYADRTDLQMTLGDCKLAVGKPIEARARYLAVTKANPDDVSAWIKLGQAAWMVKDRIRASEAGRRIVTLAPDRHEGYLLRGMIEQEAGRYSTALNQFNYAVKLSPNSSMPWLMRGMTLEQMGERDAAIESYKRAAQAAPEDPRPKQLLAGMVE